MRESVFPKTVSPLFYVDRPYDAVRAVAPAAGAAKKRGLF
jgi:hypothetical protein